jgi:hypothetical protein
MAHYSTTTGELSRRGPSCDSQHPRSLLSISYQLLRKTWPIGNESSSTRKHIRILYNDSLLNIFYLCRLAPYLSDESEAGAIRIFGEGNWNHERWWYSLVQVCRRWRYLVLESASFLGLSLLCTYGTPVADMLAYLLPLPLIIDYNEQYDELTADDEAEIILALRHYDRIRCIRLMESFRVLQRLLMVLQGEFPNLEYLIIKRDSFEDTTTVDFPKTFRAPRLRYVMAMGVYIPIDSPFTTIGNPVVLSLNTHNGDYFHPNILVLQLLVVPQRETPGNVFNSHFPSHDVDKQSFRRAILRRVTPYFPCIGFQGVNPYLETLIPRATIRLLERLQLYFVGQLIYLLPRRRKFKNIAEIPRLTTVALYFFKDH